MLDSRYYIFIRIDYLWYLEIIIKCKKINLIYYSLMLMVIVENGGFWKLKILIGYI